MSKLLSCRNRLVIVLVMTLVLLDTGPCIGLGHKSCKGGWIKKKMFGHKMIILGDSNFVFVMKEFVAKFQTISRVQKVAQYGGCQSFRHFNMDINPADVVWRSGKEQGIIAGPYSSGLRTPFCSDCTSCSSEIYDLTHKVTNTTLRLEYFPLLFSKDVTVQSRKYKTTQEHLVAYLKASGYGPLDYIVFNVGLHEMSHITPLQYGENLQFFSKLLTTVDANLIFINTPHSNLPGLPKGFDVMYTVELTDQYNAVASEVLARNHKVIGTVDTAPESLVGTEFSQYYKDGHHFLLNSTFYNAVMMKTLYTVCSLA